MLRVSFEVNDPVLGILPIVLIDYDGGRFSLLQLDDDVWQVMVKRRNGEWDYFGHRLYESFDDATKAIFYDTMLDRFESGMFVHDDFGHITESIPLSYYDRAA